MEKAPPWTAPDTTMRYTINSLVLYYYVEVVPEFPFELFSSFMFQQSNYKPEASSVAIGLIPLKFVF